MSAEQEQTLTIQQSIDLALQHYNTGELPKAVGIYQQILQADPNQPIALHFLGLIAHQIGGSDRAIKLIGDAIKSKPDYAEAHYSLGNTLNSLGKLNEAVSSYTKAIAIKPDYADAYSNLGNTFKNLGQLDESLASYSKALSIKPDFHEAYYNLGNVFQNLLRLDEAVTSYNNAIAIEPNFAEAYSNLGRALKDLGQPNEAVASYKKAIAIKPDYAEAHSNLGNTLKDLGKLDEALTCYNKAITIRPGYATAHSNLGNALQELGKLDDAVISYNKAIAIKPGYPEVHYNLGNAFHALRQIDKAVISYNKAIAINPDYVEAHNNLGSVLKELQKFNNALTSYDKAIAIKPDYAEAYWNKSLTLLLCGKFKTGWELYEWRWKTGQFESPNDKITCAQPLWLGVETLKNKTILLHSEQGIGDTIQFCRYAKLVKALGARVVMEVPKPLLSLLQNLEGIDELIEKGSSLPDFDYYCPLMSLPLAFKTKLSTIPSPSSYFKSDNAKVSKWKKRLGEKTAPRIGLVWNGSPKNADDHNRSLTLGLLMQHLPDHFEYVCLQNEIREVDREALTKSSIKYFGAEINDFTENQALCEVMDVVISVDTSVAHLSGAMGKPTWVLLPYAPDWRWLLDRNDSPWYGSVKLYRQCENRNWEPVLHDVFKSLINLN